MTTKEDIESYLIRMGVEHEELEDGLWLIKSGASAPVVLNYTPPVVVLRLKVMDLPKPVDADDSKMLGFYRRLLEINASDIVHGSYGIEENSVVISDALQLEDLDFSELRSSYESILLAASSHTPSLTELVPVAQ